MGINPADVLVFPKIQAIVRDNGTAEVVVAGNSRAVETAASLQQLRENALAIVVREAQTLDRPVRVQIEDPEGHGELIVTPDGDKKSVSYIAKAARRRAEHPVAMPAVATDIETALAASGGPITPSDVRHEPISEIPPAASVPAGTAMSSTPETLPAPAPEAEESTDKAQPERNLLPSQRPRVGAGYEGLARRADSDGFPDGPL